MSTQWNDSVLKMDGSLVVMLVVVLVLMYQVFMVDRDDINYLKKAHSKEGYINLVSNPRANSSRQIFSGGFGSREQGQDTTTSASPNVLYDNKGGLEKFLSGGGHEPPIFYDIGNLKGMKINQDSTGYMYTDPRGSTKLQNVPVVPVSIPVDSSAAKVAAAIEGMWMQEGYTNEGYTNEGYTNEGYTTEGY